MKNLMMLSSLLAFFWVGCSTTPQEKLDVAEKDRDTAQKDFNTAQKVLGDAKGGVVIAKQELVGYTYAQKNEYTNKMRKELDDISVELAQLEARIEKSTGESKVDAKLKLDEVKVQWTQAKTQLERAESSSEATWEELKSGVNKSYADLKESFIKTRQWITEKIQVKPPPA
jgi:hypothetical protein